MWSSSRLMVLIIAHFVFFLGADTASTAFAWSLRVAPLDLTTGDADAFAPSTSLPVAPQFFRILVTGTQVTLGAEAPYLRTLQPDPPIRFQSRPPAPAQPMTNARASHTRHQLRGPEAFLLRRTQHAAGKSPP